MLHLVLLYTLYIERDVDVSGLCHLLVDCMLEHLVGAGETVFPTGAGGGRCG